MVFKWLRRLLREKSNAELEERIEELEDYIQGIDSDLTIVEADLRDRIEGFLLPMSKRMNMRQTREKQKDLNTTETLKKGGVIRPQDVDKYRNGIN
jgi:hypothetical protein